MKWSRAPDLGRRQLGLGEDALARALADRLAAPHLELDAIFHQPGWEPRPVDEFRADVHDFCTGDTWVVDGNYRAVQDLVWARADTVVWLDLPRRIVMRQIIGRSVGRAALRRELWNGNRESLRSLVARDPERSVIRWAWTRHDESRSLRGGSRTTLRTHTCTSSGSRAGVRPRSS